MKRAALFLVLTVGGCGSSQPAPKFADLSITLPEDTGTFPDSPGKDAMIANCAACHSPSMILTQPKLTADQWKSTIKKMREVYKAPIDSADEPAILSYLESVSAAVR
jgi:hypothetical protein